MNNLERLAREIVRVTRYSFGKDVTLAELNRINRLLDAACKAVMAARVDELNRANAMLAASIKTEVGRRHVAERRMVGLEDGLAACIERLTERNEDRDKMVALGLRCMPYIVDFASIIPHEDPDFDKFIGELIVFGWLNEDGSPVTPTVVMPPPSAALEDYPDETNDERENRLKREAFADIKPQPMDAP